LAAPALKADLPDTIARIKPSIVGIGTHEATRAQPINLLGTGFVVADGRHVVTNAHVVSQALNVSDNEKYIMLTGRGGKGHWFPLTKVAEDRQHDLVVLKFSGPALPALAVGNSSRVREGQTYAFTGFPIAPVLGLYPVTHRGIVSAVTPIAVPMGQDRQLKAENIKRLRHPFSVFQLDAVAYPGNSGSPLYDPKSGLVVGVLNSVFVKDTRENVLAHPSGISYAIPAAYLKSLLGRIQR
jgi:S1-C subfamily serine protease